MISNTPSFCLKCVVQRASTIKWRSLYTSKATYKPTGMLPSQKKIIMKKPFSLIDGSWAENILAALQEHNFELNSNTAIFECNSGYGVLTEELLKKNVTVYSWKSNRVFSPAIQKLAEEYKNQLYPINHNFFKMAHLRIIHKMHTENRDTAVLGPVTDNFLQSYISQLVGGHIIQRDVSPLRNSQHFLIVTHKESEIMLEKDNQTQISHGNFRHVLYQLFFHTQIILKIPLNAFSPSRLSNNKRGKWDTQHLYLVHLVPDWSNLQHLDRSDIPGLVLFIKYLNQRKAQRLIPVVEQCCPGLGLNLIQDGYTMLQSVRHLQFDHYIPLYQNLLQNENLKTSALNEEIETYKAYLLSPSVDINLDNSVDGSFE